MPLVNETTSDHPTNKSHDLQGELWSKAPQVLRCATGLWVLPAECWCHLSSSAGLPGGARHPNSSVWWQQPARCHRTRGSCLLLIRARIQLRQVWRCRVSGYVQFNWVLCFHTQLYIDISVHTAVTLTIKAQQEGFHRYKKIIISRHIHWISPMGCRYGCIKTLLIVFYVWTSP